MNILILNCGSSSVKFQIIATDKKAIAADKDRRLASGIIERVGSLSLLKFEAAGGKSLREEAPIRDYRQAVDRILRWALSKESGVEGVDSLKDIHAVGHRVVHGGELFQNSTLIDDKTIAGIEQCFELAPLHNPLNLKGIRAAIEVLGPGVPQVAVFDTAFHATMPPTTHLYGIPYHLYRRHKIRRYGFHGTSHRYIRYRYGLMLGVPKNEVDIISLHLGNGCSACAIKGGSSYDTSMGFTPLEGLVMGTRSGDVDPAVVEYLHHKEGMELSEILSLLNKLSGLIGLSGLTSDMRDLLAEEREHGDRRATLAIDIFCERIKKYVGAYYAQMGGAYALVFTGGIGENSPEIRRRVCRGLDALGLKLDEKRNAAVVGGKAGEITTSASRFKAYVIPTNEELLIARDTYRAVAGVKA